jgi:tetratricopeptide (TPR) repeat protein
MRRPAIFALLSTFSFGFGLAAPDQSAAERATELAEQGKCAEAMPLIHQALEQDTQIQDRDLKRRMGAAGVRCAMMLNHQGAATTLLAWLEEQFPHDPEILFMATHVYSDLSARSSKELMDAAPDSPLVVEINAENFEKQGDWRKAIAEYRVLLDREPQMPGIHSRIGQIILTLPATATSNDEARKEFEQELKVYPQNASAEYFLGELARKGGHLPQAIEHYTNATKLNPGPAGAVFRPGPVPARFRPRGRRRGAARNGRPSGARQSDHPLHPRPRLPGTGTQGRCRSRIRAAEKHRRKDPAQHGDGEAERLGRAGSG